MSTNSKPSNLNATSSSVSVDEVRHIADLSNLRLTSEEEVSMQRDLNAILHYVAELNELDTTAIVPMAQVSEMLERLKPISEDSRVKLRPDAPRPSLARTSALENAPDTDGVFFKVPKVIER